MTKRLLPLFFLGLLAIAATGRELRPHPRLLTGTGDHPFPSAETAGAPVWVRQADSVITAFSDEALTLPPVERIKTGKRLLGISREALKRIFYLSYTYRVHGGDAYARRAVDEMLAVCAFSDWNPSHFLDVGEMAMAVAIGYDWLYGILTPEERETIVKALKEKAFDASENKKQAWFYTAENNWNSVCNAGLVFAAAAIWDEAPERCEEILRKSLESNPKTLEASFKKDGGYPEGYNYWGYGVGFQILLFDALETAFKMSPDACSFLYSASSFSSSPSESAASSISFTSCESSSTSRRTVSSSRSEAANRSPEITPGRPIWSILAVMG